MEPLYITVKSDIENKINEKFYKKGDYLPSEAELQKVYNVSRTTIRQAIRLLISDGLVTIIRGKGTKVTPSRLSYKISSLMSFTELMKQQGLVPSIKDFSVKRMKAPDGVHVKLDLSEGEEVFEIYRVRTADEEPITINTSYIPCQLLHTFDQSVFSKEQSLYMILKKFYHINIIVTEDVVTAVKATSAQAKTLHIAKNDPVLCIERLAYGNNHILVEYSKIFIRSDRFKQVYTLRSNT
ncbi:MAG TPA: hypothetical protein DDW93_07605 [Firmicutes bacterium]|jgi:GntR family transcriptional regulator|nr:hypothetical protein [Bacillota bacterium]HBK67776.1 hypothetical protein [Bacillota bacterium]HBT17811.1 hypothetical protein [Bacillota bacterium]